MEGELEGGMNGGNETKYLDTGEKEKAKGQHGVACVRSLSRTCRHNVVIF